MITVGRRTVVPFALVGAVLALGAGACGTSDEPVTALSATSTGSPATSSPAPTPAAPVSAAPVSAAPISAAPVTKPPAARTTATTSAAKATATPKNAAPTTTAPTTTGSSTEGAVVALTNDARVDAGCAALTVDRRLTKAAQGHSDDMAEQSYFSHDSRDGRSFDERIDAAGYPSPGGENIARGQRSAAAVVEAWLDSPGHRANIENCSFTTIGVGHSATGDYWTQDFGR